MSEFEDGVVRGADRSEDGTEAQTAEQRRALEVAFMRAGEREIAIIRRAVQLALNAVANGEQTFEDVDIDGSGTLDNDEVDGVFEGYVEQAYDEATEAAGDAKDDDNYDDPNSSSSKLRVPAGVFPENDSDDEDAPNSAGGSDVTVIRSGDEGTEISDTDETDPARNAAIAEPPANDGDTTVREV